MKERRRYLRAKTKRSFGIRGKLRLLMILCMMCAMFLTGCTGLAGKILKDRVENAGDEAAGKKDRDKSEDGSVDGSRDKDKPDGKSDDKKPGGQSDDKTDKKPGDADGKKDGESPADGSTDDGSGKDRPDGKSDDKKPDHKPDDKTDKKPGDDTEGKKAGEDSGDGSTDGERDGEKPRDKKSEPFGKEIAINSETQKKMNIFLSNFSEAGLTEYDEENRDLYRIFRWINIWSKINKYKSIEYGNRPGDASDTTYEKISLENLNKVTDRYLGFTLTDAEASKMYAGPEESAWFFYEDGYLYHEAADGESYTNLSVVTKAEDLGGGKLKLSYTVYSQDLDEYFEGVEKDKYYKMTGEEAAKNSKLEVMASGYAVVRTEGGSYKLEYLWQEWE